MNNLYRNATDEGVQAAFKFDSQLIIDALKRIHGKQIDTKEQIDEGLFQEVKRVFDQAAQAGVTSVAYVDTDKEFLKELQKNNTVFAAFKVHRMGNDMASQLYDENGNVKSFPQFKADTQSMVSHHRDHWLKTEFNTAVKRARKAAEMKKFLSEADVLPNIKWLPSTAVHPRELHKPFYNRIWPAVSLFWQEHRPGDLWGCQCDWEATDEEPTDNSGIWEPAPPAPGLGGDPAQTGQLFSQDHPYFPDTCSVCPFNDQPLKRFRNKVKDCYHCRSLVKALKLDQLTFDASKRAEQIREIRRQAERNIKEKTLPEPIISTGGQYYTGKIVCSKGSIKNAVRHCADINDLDVALNIEKYIWMFRYQRTEKPVHLNEKKITRGVQEYSVYEFSLKGKIYLVKCEVILVNNQTYEERPYIVYKVKK